MHLSGYELGVVADPDVDQSVSYSYDNVGRLLSVTSTTDDFAYSRVPNSDSLAGMTGPVHAVEYAYEANCDAQTQVENIKTFGTPVTVSSYAYSYDALGRRAERNQSGAAFSSSSVDTFDYNDRSEVIGSVNDVTAAFDFAYAYDNIGNRKTSEVGTTPVRAYSGKITA